LQPGLRQALRMLPRFFNMRKAESVPISGGLTLMSTDKEDETISYKAALRAARASREREDLSIMVRCRTKFMPKRLCRKAHRGTK